MKCISVKVMDIDTENVLSVNDKPCYYVPVTDEEIKLLLS